MLDVAAHMLLLQRQAKIKHERPVDDSFLPLSLTIACLLRQLPAGLAPPAGILSLHQIDRLPMEILEQKLVHLVYGEGADDLPPRGSAILARAFAFLRAMVVYVKTTRAMLVVCHDHMTDRLTTEQTMPALVEAVMGTLGGGEEAREEVDEKDEGEMAIGNDVLRRQQLSDGEEARKQDEDGVPHSPAEDDGDSSEGEIAAAFSAPPHQRNPVRSSRSRTRQRGAAKVGLPPAPATACPPADRDSRLLSQAVPISTSAVDPAGIMKRALARDAGDGSAIIGIMKKYPQDPRIQTHGVRALKTAIRKFPFPSRNQKSREDNSSDEDDERTSLEDPDELHRREVVQLVLHTMKRYPARLALQRDALFCLLEYVSHADDHVAIVASLGGIVSIMEAMARLPDDEEAQIAALSVLGHPTLAEESVVRVNPESRRLVLSAMRRFPLGERLQGLACLALANLSLRQEDSMREIVSRGGLELVVAAMNRFSDVSLIQAAGCWLVTIVSSKDGAYVFSVCGYLEWLS
jgi:hypothetical protein